MRLQQSATLVSIGAVLATVLTPYPANASVRPTLKADRGLTGTLTVQTETAITPGLEAVIQQYQRVHPGVHFSLINLNTTTARAANILALSSSGAPDIGWVELSTGVYSTLMKRNELTSLAPLWKADNLTSEYPSGSVAYMNSGTSPTPYGMLLFAGLGSMIFYNKTDFTKAGVQPPAGREFQSMAQFNALTSKLKAHGFTPLAVGCNSPVELGHLVDDLLPTSATPAQFHAYETNWVKGSKSSVTYTDPAFVNVLKQIKLWTTDGVIEPACLAVNDSQQTALFTDGETAMDESSTYGIPGLYAKATKPSFPVGWFMMPPMRPGVKVPFWNYSGSMYVVPTHAPDKALAMNFLQFLGQRTMLSLYAAHESALPVIRDAVPEPEPYPMLSQVIALEKKVGSDLIWDSAVPNTLGQKFEVPLLETMVAGKISVTATARKFQAALVALQTGKVIPPGQ